MLRINNSWVGYAMWIMVLVAALLSCKVMGEGSGEESEGTLSLRMQHRQALDLREVLTDIKTLLILQSQQSGQIRELVGRMDTMEETTKARMDTLEDMTKARMDTMENMTKAQMDTLEDINTWMDTIQSQQQDILDKVDNSRCDSHVIGIPVQYDKLGWMVIQSRVDNEYDFITRTWAEYKNGFGDKFNSFWLGLAHIHRITNSGRTSLRVELTAFDDEFRFAEYESFRVASEEEEYRLHVSGYSGTAGDCLWYHDGRNFTTVDRNQLALSSRRCAEPTGGWWYNDCHYSNLNAVYRPSGRGPAGYNIAWADWLGYERTFKKVMMKLRWV
jgi:hypothetical protein